MLKVQVPQLQKINPSLFEGLFFKFWPHYFRNELQGNLNWGLLQSEFFYTGQSIAIAVYSGMLRELFDAVNLGRSPNFQRLDVDLAMHFDAYEADDVGTPYGFENDVVESQIYGWLDSYSTWLMSNEMLVNVTQVFEAVYNDLKIIKEQHGLLGYWYEFYTTESKLWESNSFAIGIQEGDFEAIYYGPWQGHAGDEFYNRMDVHSWEFFLSDGKLYLEDGATQIPVGQMTTMCRLNDLVGKMINF
ncbi:hypothetical protein STRATTON_230 [Erwinia phage vB_EamM_Stratton]|uniref:Uncharacterized protein n=1 Tax=Erwinia phage vB_EamM_Stratton TaxID=1883378 RepID=A0A1B2IHF8_9CAUD|nr:hypothetical protein STRATTON_230 [Erwinia phage vB_EamM_Stratton]